MGVTLVTSAFVSIAGGVEAIGVGRLEAEQRVAFDIAQSPKGPRATNERSAEKGVQR